MAMGLEQSGLRHVALVEWDRHCVHALRRNGFRNVIHRNANHVDYAEFAGVDVVAGGPPCQPFSKGGVDGGADDERDGWPTAIRAVREMQPRGFLFENVSGMAREKFKAYRESIVKRFYDLGYSVHVHVVEAADYGVPQHRKRLIMAGIRGVSWFQCPPPLDTPPLTVRDMMAALGPPTGRNGHELHGVTPKPYGIGHIGSVMDKPAKTLVASAHGTGGGMGVVTLDDGTMRHFTLREMCRLQTFPDTYKLPPTWSHAIRLLGNACPTLLSKLFADELLHRIQRTHKAQRTESPSMRRPPGPLA
jgi:DNA (cytosine-5)-methyltransferase 1